MWSTGDPRLFESEELGSLDGAHWSNEETVATDLLKAGTNCPVHGTPILGHSRLVVMASLVRRIYLRAASSCQSESRRVHIISLQGSAYAQSQVPQKPHIAAKAPKRDDETEMADWVGGAIFGGRFFWAGPG